MEIMEIMEIIMKIMALGFWTILILVSFLPSLIALILCLTLIKKNPYKKLGKKQIYAGFWQRFIAGFIDLIILTKLEDSKSEIRRLIKGKGIKINNKIIFDEKLKITKDLFKDNLIKLSLGKKRHIKIKIN